RRLNPRVPRDLETICRKCLRKDPARRYGSAEALAEDLERWLNGEPIRARPSGVWERGWKWARRRPAVAALVALAVLAPVGLLAAGYLHNRQLEDALTRTRQARADADAARVDAVSASEEAERKRQAAVDAEQETAKAKGEVEKEKQRVEEE